MFNFSQLKSIHLEITNNCQASCPMCSRNIHGGLDNPLLKLSSWSLQMFKDIMTESVLNQIDSYYFCGNFGDPILNNHLLDMCRYSTELAPNTPIRIHTNGGARNEDWWTMLAQSLPKEHSVIFALDGLEDTHEMYRIGTSYKKIIDNACAFIKAGGNAEWAFIRFKHNEHQVEKARETAKKLGFKNFTMKDSSRFLLDPKFPVYDKTGSVTHYIEPSGVSEIKFIDRKSITNYQKIVANTDIDCAALNFKEIYIDAFGKVFPCCYIAMIPYIPTNIDSLITDIRNEILVQYNMLVNDLGGYTAIDAQLNSIKDIIDSEPYQTVWYDYWNNKKLITCTRTCGITKEFSKPKDQFITTENLQLQ
jgi:MoaA/NifB/PqqE/SkfB family radical SAM enzyme